MPDRRSIAHTRDGGSGSAFAAVAAPVLAALVSAAAVAPVAAVDDARLEDISVRLEPVASGFERPIWVTHAGDGSGDLYVVEQPGRIRVLQPDGSIRETPFLDIADRVVSEGNEQGLLGLAFHPDYEQNGRFFVHHTRKPEDAVVISEFVALDGVGDPTSERVILEVPQPGDIHNGGTVLFDEHGYLLISLGDGGRMGDTVEFQDDPTTLYGKILRIDVDGGDPYAIPPGNGFAGHAEVRPEVHLMGFRNPFRFSLDPHEGHIIIGDVGHADWEEIDVAPPGASALHFGWIDLEGPECAPRPRVCDPGDHEPPTIAYSHLQGGGAIIGGVVYRGAAEPELEDVYLFGDWARNEIYGVTREDLLSGGTDLVVLGALEGPGRISSFGEDGSGEVYVPDGRDTIYRVAGRPRG